MITKNLKDVSLFTAMIELFQIGGFLRFFDGLSLILMRQIPYTCTKLVGYELISDYLDKTFNDNNNNNISYTNNNISVSSIINKKSRIKEIVIPLSSGIIAGILAAIVSHPADYAFSKLCSMKECLPSTRSSTTSKVLQLKSTEKGYIQLLQIINELGLIGCYIGIGPRALMIAILTAMQFFLYEKFRKIFRV